MSTVLNSIHPLSSFKPGFYTLLLLDIKMPRIDGIELYEEIKEGR